MQEKVTELSSELAAHQNGNVNHSRLYLFLPFSFKWLRNVIFNLNLDAKGNSLFAEVDDQRQQMRDMLSRQKSEYLWVSIFC